MFARSWATKSCRSRFACALTARRRSYRYESTIGCATRHAAAMSFTELAHILWEPVLSFDDSSCYYSIRMNEKWAARKARYAPLQAAKDRRRNRGDQEERKLKGMLGSQESSLSQSGNAHQVGNSQRRPRLHQRMRSGPTPEELHWRQSVLLRDGHRCVFCGATENLEADHIKPKVHYPDLKYDIDNGRTLCNPCHRKTETYGSKVHRLVSVAVSPA